MEAAEGHWEQVKQGKKKEEEDKHRGKAGNVKRKGWGWSWKKMKSLCRKAGWEVCFVQKILKGWTKKAVPTKVSSPPGLGLESKAFALSIALVQANRYEK